MTVETTFEDREGDAITLRDEGDHEPLLVTSPDGAWIDLDTAAELAIAILRAVGWSGEITLDESGAVSITT